MSNAIIIIPKLESAGFDRRQAEAVAELFVDEPATPTDVQTATNDLKRDIADVRGDLTTAKAELKQDVAEVKQDISKSKFEIVRRTVGAQLAFAALMVRTFKPMH